MILYVNACPRAESRTDRMARALLERLGAYTELDLKTAGLAPMTEEKLARRDALIAAQAWDDPSLAAAKAFAEAEEIVVAAPYWDLSFPAEMKVFWENVYVVGLTSRYSEEGIPVGLCRAKKLWYVTTAGGPYDPRFSYDYVRALATGCFGIPETELIKAEMLDVAGFDSEAIVAETVRKIRAGL